MEIDMKKTRLTDGRYENMATGLGQAGADKTVHTHAGAYRDGDDKEYALMTLTDGIASKIVSGVVASAFKEEVSVIGDPEGKLLKLAAGTGLFRALRSALEYERMIGGALVVTTYSGDGTDLSKAPDAGERVTGYRVFSKGRVLLQPGDFDELGRIAAFRVRKRDGAEFTIAAERCTVVRGLAVPDVITEVSLNDEFFGSAPLARCETSLKSLASVIGNVVSMADECGIAVFSLANLNMMLSKPDCGINDLQKLMSAIKLSMSGMRAVFQDKDDSFSMMSHDFNGLPDVIQKLRGQVASDSGIPESILFGQTASGLSQTNAADEKQYALMVEEWRSEYAEAPLVALLSDLARRNTGIAGGVEGVEFGAVIPMTLPERQTAMKMQADTMKMYFDMGVLTAGEIRENVFKNGHSFNVSVK